jgi:hypothetical protein
MQAGTPDAGAICAARPTTRWRESPRGERELRPAGKDADRVSVAVLLSNAVAADAIPVKLKVNDSSAGIPGAWDVDESNTGSLVLLRRTLFKYKASPIG